MKSDKNTSNSDRIAVSSRNAHALLLKKSNKRVVYVVVAVVCLLLISGLVIHISSKASSLNSKGWQLFQDLNDSVVFRYPGSLMGVPSGGPISPDGHTYKIQFPGTGDKNLYNFALNNAENKSPTSNLLLSITLYDSVAANIKYSPNGINEDAIAANYAFKRSLEYLLLPIVQKSGKYSYKLSHQQNGKSYLLQCLSSISCSQVIKRANTAYPYAVVTISSQEGYRYGDAIIDTGSHNYLVMNTVLNTLSLDMPQANATAYAAANNQAPYYKYISQPLIDDIERASVTAIDADKRMLTLQYYPSTHEKLRLNEAFPEPTTVTLSIPQTVRIIGGGLYQPMSFEQIRIGDNVTLYQAIGSHAIGTVYDDNG